MDPGGWSVGLDRRGLLCVQRIIRGGGNVWGLLVLVVERRGSVLVVEDYNRRELVFEFGDPGFDVDGFVLWLVGVVEREFFGDRILSGSK